MGTINEIDAIRMELGCSLQDAFTIVIKRDLVKKVESATTVDELKPVLIKLINDAPSFP